MNYTTKIVTKLSLFTLVLMTGIVFTTNAAAQESKLTDMQKKAADAYVAAWNTGNIDALDKYLTKDVVRRLPQSVEASNSNNLTELKKEIAGFRTLFPDVKVTTEKIIMQGDVAVVRWTLTGTNKVKAMGYPGDGSKVNLQGVSVINFENGLMKEESVYYDVYTLRTQMGLNAGPPSKTAEAEK